MPRIDDIESRQRYIKSRFKELINLCQKDNNGMDNHDQIRNCAQSILNDEVKLLDNLAFLIFEIAVAPAIRDPHHRKACERNVYFPYVQNENELIAKLRIACMNTLRKTHPKIYAIFEKNQSYNGAEWNRVLHKLANLGHRKTVLHRKKITGVNTPIGTLPVNEMTDIRIKDVVVSGPQGVYVIDDLSIKNGEITGFDPNTMRYQISYIEEETKQDLLSLILISIRKIEEITQELREHISR